MYSNSFLWSCTGRKENNESRRNLGVLWKAEEHARIGRRKERKETTSEGAYLCGQKMHVDECHVCLFVCVCCVWTHLQF